MFYFIRMQVDEPTDSFSSRFRAHRRGDQILKDVISNKEEWQKIAGDHCRLLHITRFCRKMRRGDLSLLVHANGDGSVSDKLLTRLSKEPDLKALWVIHLQQAIFFPVPRDTANLQRFVLAMDVAPAALHSTYERLERSSLPKGMLKSYLACTFSSFSEPLRFSLLAPSPEQVEAYATQKLEAISGVRAVSILPVELTQPLISYSEWQDYTGK